MSLNQSELQNLFKNQIYKLFIILVYLLHSSFYVKNNNA
jgi:hypothetical protein